MRYTIPFENVSTGATADVFRTIAALIMPTSGGTCRAAIEGLRLGCGDASPSDLTLVARIRRVLTGSSKGSPGTTIAAANIPKKDNLSQDAPFTAGINYSGGEPSYEAKTLWEFTFNTRTGLFESLWGNEIIGNYDQVIGLEVAPRTSAARAVYGSLDICLR